MRILRTENGGGGEGGLVCIALNGTSGKGNQLQVSFQWKNPDFLLKNLDFLLENPDFLLKNPDFTTKQVGGKPDWTNTTRGLYDVVSDPREMNDLQDEKPEIVAAMVCDAVLKRMDLLLKRMDLLLKMMDFAHNLRRWRGLCTSTRQQSAASTCRAVNPQHQSL